LKTTGLNTLSADLDVDENGVITRFEVLQSGAAPGAGERRPHRLAIGTYDRDQTGRLVRTNRVELDVAEERTAVPGLVGVPRGALVLLNDDDLTYCKARLDATSLSTAIDGIADVADSLPRTLLWSAVWEMTRDALMRARDFVILAVRGVRTEDQIGVLQRVLAQLQVAVGAYAEPEWAAQTGWPTVAAALHDLAVGAEPGSDTQLAAVQAFAGAKLNPAQLAVIAGWLDGSAALAGLTVDTDLSWTLLGALVAHGAAGDPEIDAAAAADSTASGARRATTVRALRPDADNKAAVWERLINDDGMANALQDAAIAGFTHPSQAQLLAPYVEKYFQDVAGVWERRSIEVAQKVAVGLFPRWAVDQRTVDLALAWEEQEHPPALRRLVSEGRAGIERSLRARAADAKG
jgi:aminopeptidase N